MKQRIEDMGYISLEKLKEQAKDAETLRLSLEVYEKQTRRSRLRSFFNGLCKKAVYITSVPFYWFIIFKYMMGWFNPGFFMFVILCSIILSVGGGSWGILNFGIRA